MLKSKTQMSSTLFEQQRIVTAQIRSNYFTILHENEDLRKLVTKLQKENEHLIQLRNWLLPMLMNGQATITN